MHSTTHAYALLNASLESHEEPGEERAIPKGHGLESLDMREHAQVLKLLDQRIQHDLRTLDVAVNLHCAMESHSGSLSPFQAQMMTIAANQIDFELAHQRHGFGLESYSGPHGRILLRASTEGFVSWLKQFLEKLAKLWKRFVAWLKTFFDRRFHHLRMLRSALGGKLQRASISGGSMRAYQAVFVNSSGKIDVEGVIKRSQKYIDSVMSAEYMTKVTGYSTKVTDVAEKFLTAEGNSWRKFAAEVTQAEFPVPSCFSKHETKNKATAYVSDEMANRRIVRLEVAEGENVQGHRGAGEYVDQLAVSEVSVFVRQEAEPKSLAEAMMGGLNKMAIYTKDQTYRDICKLIDAAIASESRTRPFLKTSEAMVRRIEELKNKADSAEGVDPHAARLAAQLLSSVKKSDKAAADLLDVGLSIAEQIGNAGTHLAALT